jgi:hypothetical protein
LSLSSAGIWNAIHQRKGFVDLAEKYMRAMSAKKIYLILLLLTVLMVVATGTVLQIASV